MEEVSEMPAEWTGDLENRRCEWGFHIKGIDMPPEGQARILLVKGSGEVSDWFDLDGKVIASANGSIEKMGDKKMRLIDADAFDGFLNRAEMEAKKKHKYVFANALNTIRGNLRKFPPAEAKTKCIAQIKVDTEELVRRIKEEAESCSYFLAENNDGVVAWMPLPTPYMTADD